MSDHFKAVAAYQAALGGSDDAAVQAVADLLADDVLVQTNFGKAEGMAAALALLGEPRTAGLLAGGAQWSTPAEVGDKVVVTATFAEGGPFAGLELAFEFAGDKISSVEQQTLPAPPPQPVALALTPEISELVNGALDNQTPMLIAYRDAASQIHLSFRGTIQAYSGTQLALWARDPQGGLPSSIVDRPEVTLFYHDPARRTTYSFYGRARLENDPAARTAIFENSPPREQLSDFRRRGVAIVVDLDKVEGRGPGGRVLMLAEC